MIPEEMIFNVVDIGQVNGEYGTVVACIGQGDAFDDEVAFSIPQILNCCAQRLPFMTEQPLTYYHLHIQHSHLP